VYETFGNDGAGCLTVNSTVSGLGLGSHLVKYCFADDGPACKGGAKSNRFQELDGLVAKYSLLPLFIISRSAPGCTLETFMFVWQSRGIGAMTGGPRAGATGIGLLDA
jgi:hypothetical protein